MKSNCLQLDLPEEDATMDDLTAALVQRYGDWIKDLLMNTDSGYLSGAVAVVVDGQAVGRQRPEDVRLKDGSTVWLVLALEGG